VAATTLLLITTRQVDTRPLVNSASQPTLNANSRNKMIKKKLECPLWDKRSSGSSSRVRGMPEWVYTESTANCSVLG